MTRALQALAHTCCFTLLVACGGDTAPERAASSTSPSADDLVVETREITDEELASLSDDDGHAPLACPDMGAATWDYGPITEDEGGRQPADALRDAIAELNDDGLAVLPATGWVELVVEDGARNFVLEDQAGAFTASVTVEGDPALGAWRHNEAYVCLTARP
jgi:hypothetical protein